MKTLNSSLFSLLFLASAAEAADIAVPCDVSYVYCMSEFTSAVAGKKSVEDAIQLLPVNVLRNLTLKRGNNITKKINGLEINDTTDLIVGPHGHLAPSSDSQSASPSRPRVFVWDEKSGFTASWNSGHESQTANDRIDLYDFDFINKKHRLTAWTAKDGILDHNTEDKNGRKCVTCHGAEQRPIFPMYPDWPQFYGEFNDEMASYTKDILPGNDSNAIAIRPDLLKLGNLFQPTERKLYLNFLENQGTDNPRYSLIYGVTPEETSDGVKTDFNILYPFRPRTIVKPFADISRAFFYRPNLRLGIMYNRLTALQIFERIKASPVFQKYPDVIFFALTDCNWNFSTTKTGQNERNQILTALLEGASAIDDRFKGINLRGAKFSADDIKDLNSAKKAAYIAATENSSTVYYRHQPYTTDGYQQIPYEDLLSLIDLKVQDLDIRFRFDATKIQSDMKFDVYDPRAFHFTQSVMDIGYIEPTYALNPICDSNSNACNFTYSGTYMHGQRYFSSYFDGSATMNELLVAQMLTYLTDASQDFSNKPELAAVREKFKTSIPNPSLYFQTLKGNYEHFANRYDFDKTFFARMDLISPYVPLPYTEDLLDVHNREYFWSNGSKPLRMRHAQWETLADREKNRANRNNGDNLCWNIYDSMKARLVK